MNIKAIALASIIGIGLSVPAILMRLDISMVEYLINPVSVLYYKS